MSELIIAVIVLLIFIAWQDWQRRKERQEFFDYIKAKDIKELREIREVTKEVKSTIVAPEDITLEQATDAQFDLAIKKELGREPLIEKVKEKVRRIHAR